MSRVLSPEFVLLAYRAGYFPMADPHGRVHWLSPDPRCVFELERFRVTRSLRQAIRNGGFELRINAAFDEVIAACGDRREGTWISPEIRQVYQRLHRLGWAHSVEAWRDGALRGGLYGIAIGGAFFGESMFHRAANASKVALAALMQRLHERGFAFVDAQMSTPHLFSLGAIEIPRTEYLCRLREALACTPGPLG
ncbi:MAG: leucyl/phenylalanyl-tRNA--protein transferase [Phycisphaerae bacterium]